ncbi:MAG: NUDIX domain-containing protein [Desulfobacterales bacterium]|nr:NUDIX domain-containing protein [Desulfobacterales bacterium]
MDNRPKVGIAVIVLKNKKVLLCKRKNTHGEGTWCFPGGYLEYGESFEICAKREVLEETGLKIFNIRHSTFTNNIFEKEALHTVTLFMIADYESGSANVREPDKCEKWDWFDWNDLPKPLFLPIRNLIANGFDIFQV